MNLLSQYTIQLVGLIFGSASLGSIMMYYSNKNKLKAETNNLIGKTYGDLIDDLRKTVDYQGAQIRSMQEREVELLKIITSNQKTERELRKQISDLENKLLLYIKNNP
jgi:uncharacterized protein YebE (UPF0316 family)